MRKIKVLVVDDSALFRRAVAEGLNKHPLIRVAAVATDPYEARDRILDCEPDVMVLDVELPRMNGILFLRKLLPQYPLPVVVMSSNADHVFTALSCGAVDFAAKPGSRKGESVTMPEFLEELQQKVQIAARAALPLSSPEAGAAMPEKPRGAPAACDLIAIGASTGGTEAILAVLKGLPKDSPGIAIVQHMPPGFTASYAERLNRETALEVKEAVQGDVVQPGRALLAPGNRQMKLVRRGGKYRAEVYEGERVNGHCPSVDVLFESAAQAGPRAIGVLLTGMGSDGAVGLLRMRQNGAYTIGQDEASSVVYGMPKVAHEIGAVGKQVPLQLIASVIKQWAWRN